MMNGLFIARYGWVFIPIVLFVLVMSIVLHEIAHGLAAKWNGDQTAKFAKRLSLNPVRHFDLLGFIMLAFVGFGFAKPVPVNIENFRHRKKGVITVSLAGIITNIGLALIAAFFLVVVERFGAFNQSAIMETPRLFHPGAYMPLDRVTSYGVNGIVSYVFIIFFSTMLSINIFLALFNLLPLWPLDGHRVLEATLGSYNKLVKFLRDWGIAILLALLGISVLFFIITQFVDFRLELYAPLNAYSHFVGGGISQSFANLFRWMFGIRRQWLF